MEQLLPFESSLLWAQDWAAILIFAIFFVVGELLLIKLMKDYEHGFGTFLVLNIFLIFVGCCCIVPLTLLIIGAIIKFTTTVAIMTLIMAGFVALKLLIYNKFVKGDKE